MNKAGFVFSLVGGVLAILFSVLLPVSGLYFFAGSDAARFAAENEKDLLTIVTNIAHYNDVPMFWEGELEESVSGFEKVVEKLDAKQLRKIGDEYDMKAYSALSRLYADVDGFVPKLRLCTIACLAASVIAMMGAAIAKAARVAGGVMVLASAGLLLIFSLLASSILPMALASLLLVAGGLMQIARPKPAAPAKEVAQ